MLKLSNIQSMSLYNSFRIKEKSFIRRSEDFTSNNNSPLKLNMNLSKSRGLLFLACPGSKYNDWASF